MPPYGFGLRLNAANTAEHSYSAVQNSEGSLHFQSEVNVNSLLKSIEEADLDQRKSQWYKSKAGGSALVDFAEWKKGDDYLLDRLIKIAELVYVTYRRFLVEVLRDVWTYHVR